MVEKISERSVNAAIKPVAPSSDDLALLAKIEKKKKEKHHGQNVLPAAMALSQIPLLLAHSSFTKGGRQESDNHQVKKERAVLSTPGGLAHFDQNTEHLQRQTILSTARGESTLKTSHQPVAGGTQTKSQEVHTTSLLPDIPYTPSVTARTSQALSASQALLASQALSAQQALPEVGHHKSRKNQDDDMKPMLQAMKPVETAVSPQAKSPTQDRSLPTALAAMQQRQSQANGADAVTRSESRSQKVEVDYQFQRWSGEHSVKVSIPVAAHREGNITLLPSDMRAANALSDNMGHLMSHNPDLLLPQRDQDEREQRQHWYQQEEDQE